MLRFHSLLCDLSPGASVACRPPLLKPTLNNFINTNLITIKKIIHFLRKFKIMEFSGCCIIGSWSVLWCLVAATATKIAQMPEQINIPNSDNGQITTIFQISNLNKWILSDADCHPYPHNRMSVQILLKINGSHFIIFLLHWTSALTRIELHSRRLENWNKLDLQSAGSSPVLTYTNYVPKMI